MRPSIVLIALLLANPLWAQQIQQESNLVYVPVTVMNYQGRIMTGLQAAHFQLFEDGKEQEILHCSIEDTPVSVSVVLDFSGSMGEVINGQSKENMAVAALGAFVRQSNPQDEFSLVAFNERARVVVDWTSNSNELLQAILAMGEPKGRTAFLDGMYLASSQMRTARHSRKAILLITDGGDNHSRYTETDIKRVLKETDIQLYAIGLFNFNPINIINANDVRSPEELKGPALLEELTDLSGGLVYLGSNNPRLLKDIAEHIAQVLRDHYILTYRPSTKNLHAKEYHKLKVKLHKLPKGTGPLIPYARYGYKSEGRSHG